MHSSDHDGVLIGTWMIEFDVIGEPKPQGSKRQVPIRNRDGRIVQKDGRDLTRIVEDNPRLPQWKQEIAQAARDVYRGILLEGPLELTLTFYRPRPVTHFGTGRNTGVLKVSAPLHPTQRPDTLKLARAVEDALTGVIWRDDAQVVGHHLSKRYGEYFRVSVRIKRPE